MAKLYFRHGTVGSAKTLNLLAVAHNYRQQNKPVLLIKPANDSRFGLETIQSRAGLHAPADMLVSDHAPIEVARLSGIHCLLADEAQFLPVMIVEQLRKITIEQSIPAICYGLRADFRGNLFPGSQRLLELADSIEEIKTTCAFCNHKAIMNLKHQGGVATLAGPSVDLGAEEKYFPACYACYVKELARANLLPPKSEPV